MHFTAMGACYLPQSYASRVWSEGEASFVMLPRFGQIQSFPLSLSLSLSLSLIILDFLSLADFILFFFSQKTQTSSKGFKITTRVPAEPLFCPFPPSHES